MQINYLSNALLTLLLLPLVQKAEPTPNFIPTITWVGSLAQAFNSIASDPALTGPPSTSILPYFADEATYSRLRRYPDTKLFVALFVRELAHHLEESDPGRARVVINNVCPGTVNTGADNNLPFWMRIPMNLNRAVRARTVQEGARAVLWAAMGQSHHEGGSRNGFYVADNRVTR